MSFSIFSFFIFCVIYNIQFTTYNIHIVKLSALVLLAGILSVYLFVFIFNCQFCHLSARQSHILSLVCARFSPFCLYVFLFFFPFFSPFFSPSLYLSLSITIAISTTHREIDSMYLLPFFLYALYFSKHLFHKLFKTVLFLKKISNFFHSLNVLFFSRIKEKNLPFFLSFFFFKFLFF